MRWTRPSSPRRARRLREFAGRRSFVAFMPNPVDAAVETGRAFDDPAPGADLVFPAGDDSPRQLGGGAVRPIRAGGRPARRPAQPAARQPGPRPAAAARARLFRRRWRARGWGWPCRATATSRSTRRTGWRTCWAPACSPSWTPEAGFQAMYGPDALDDLHRPRRPETPAPRLQAADDAQAPRRGGAGLAAHLRPVRGRPRLRLPARPAGRSTLPGLRMASRAVAKVRHFSERLGSTGRRSNLLHLSRL